MRELKLLRKRVKTMWAMEADLSPNERELHQWQILAYQTSIPYLVGKGGANTFFYRIGEGQMQYAMPDEMFAILDKWLGAEYVSFTISKTKNLGNAPIRSTKEAFLKVTKDKYLGYYLIGLKSNGDLARLYKLEQGLKGNQWVPFKAKKKRK